MSQEQNPFNGQRPSLPQDRSAEQPVQGSQPAPGQPVPPRQPAHGQPMQNPRPMQNQQPYQGQPVQTQQMQAPQQDASLPFNPPRTRKISGPVDPFNPEGVVFKGVSRSLAMVRVVPILISAAIVMLSSVAFAYFAFDFMWYVFGAEVFFFGWLLWLVPRQVRAIGYAEAESDLLIRSGVMFKKMTVVPYGRMQYVDVSEGPIARMFGIAEVKLHTASAATDATIPGLPAAEAARLRSRLAERGEAEMAGL
mgnify:CR=1 FL=1